MIGSRVRSLIDEPAGPAEHRRQDDHHRLLRRRRHQSGVGAHVVDVNLYGTYWMVQACARVMPPGGSIIDVSSVMALTTAKMPAAAYSASKAAVLGLTRDLAAQLGPKGIRVNAILPGVFPSEATAHYSENYKRKIVDTRIPIGRIGDPEDIAAGRGISGQRRCGLCHRRESPGRRRSVG